MPENIYSQSGVMDSQKTVQELIDYSTEKLVGFMFFRELYCVTWLLNQPVPFLEALDGAVECLLWTLVGDTGFTAETPPVNSSFFFIADELAEVAGVCTVSDSLLLLLDEGLAASSTSYLSTLWVTVGRALCRRARRRYICFCTITAVSAISGFKKY